MVTRHIALGIGIGLFGLATPLAGAGQQPTAPVYNPTNPQPAATGETPSISVGSDDRVTFRIHAPEAMSVTLNGDFLLGSPAVNLEKGADGTWSYTSGPLKPDSYTYNFTVDGVMVLDTRNENFKNTPNSLFNFFDMPDPSTDFMALKDVPHGRVEAVLYHSASLNQERRVHVYLPPGFETLHGKLPVLYLFHGAGDNDISWTSAGKINLVLDSRAARRSAVRARYIPLPHRRLCGVAWEAGFQPLRRISRLMVDRARMRPAAIAAGLMPSESWVCSTTRSSKLNCR